MTILLYAGLVCAAVVLAVYWHARRRLRQFSDAERLAEKAPTPPVKVTRFGSPLR